MEKFFTTDIFILILLPSSFVVGLALIQVANRDITRAGVMFWGVALIILAGYIASQLIAWDGIGEAITKNKDSKLKVTEKAFADFKRTSALLLWVIPFVTGSLGTNFISDALMNHDRYKTPSKNSIVAKLIFWMSKKFAFVTLWVVLNIIEYTWKFLSKDGCRRKWRYKARMYRRAYRLRYSASKQPWQK